ncbi:protein Lilipod isoform X1 [Dermacentor andersoni]|uniref:protein Lilipod isoform X1 n=2 Tax=Dermacentor andersoni TaxID=34620 RepID=UPI0021551102|nr:protein Lilipod-like isoform X1 [Dermacentor andersoni]
MENDTDARERLFHNAIREILIHFLFFLILYVFAYLLISKFKKKKEYYFAEDDEDAIVYRISLWMCCFSLAVSLGAALLLPVSIISNEVLLLYPSSFYMQWLNSSLIHGLWNEIFLFSNISIFILLPFAYLFTESEGLPGSRKGLISRLYETFLVLTLGAALLFGMTFLLSAILDYGRSSIHSFFALWSGYLPFLYSCLSCFGVVLLLICTPVGFARLFTVLGELVIKPKFLRDIQDEYHCAVMEEENLRRRAYITSHELEIHYSVPGHRNGTNGCAASVFQRKLSQLGKMRRELALQQLASPWRRNLGYPLAMLALLSLTIISLLMVIHNTLQLLIGIKALPVSPQVEQFSLGISSLSALGVVGSSLEIVLILYLWLASVVGFFTLPVFCRLRPKPSSATLTQIIGNCAVLLVLSSALPVLARTLGITNFDLLGDFGRIEWLASFPLVLTYNVVFVAAAATSLATKVTATVRTELLGRLAAWGTATPWLVPKED